MIKEKSKKFELKNLLPFVLFLIVLINYIPLFINNFNKKTSNAVETKAMVIAFGIECILLFIFLVRTIKFNKKFIINSILLAITTIVLLVIQLKSYLAGSMQIMDLANIASITVNIAILYLAFLNVHIEEKNVFQFFIGIVLLGLIACAINVIIYRTEILRVLGIGGEAKLQNVKSFFAHRNQFAMFLYFSIVSSVILFINTNKKWLKVLLAVTILIFGISILITASRTGIACTLIFSGLFFVTTDRLKIRTKIIISLIGILVLLVGAFVLFNNFPDLGEKIKTSIQKVLIREQTIKTFTGRATFWDLAINLLMSSPISMLFGVGRFAGLELIEGYRVTQFHNFYIEALVAGGIMELLYLLFIYFTVIKNVIKSNIDKKYKILYICLYISYAIYCNFESLGRFSIGCADTMCLVFLVTIPLLHSNVKITQENENIQDKEEKLDEVIKNKKEKLPYRRKMKKA